MKTVLFYDDFSKEFEIVETDASKPELMRFIFDLELSEIIFGAGQPWEIARDFSEKHYYKSIGTNDTIEKDLDEIQVDLKFNVTDFYNLIEEYI